MGVGQGRCQHRRSAHRWTRVWDLWLAGSVGGFVVIEVAAVFAEGENGTLTQYVRRAIGDEPRCRHRAYGQAALTAFFAWCIAHLAFGRYPRQGWLDQR